MSGKPIQSFSSSEEQIRQKIRAQLQQRLPPLAQQFPDSDRQSNDLDGGLQSFGGNAVPSSSDFFNSDSFRATNNSQDNRIGDSEPRRAQNFSSAPADLRQQSQNTKVVDLSHMQPFQHQFFAGGDELEDVDERKSEDEQSIQRDPAHPESMPQKQRRNTPPNDVDESPEAPNENIEHQQLSPNEEFAFQQRLIEGLINENSKLKQELQQSEVKLQKVEYQLAKNKQYVKELCSIKDEIQTINMKANLVEDYDQMATENEILKSKLSDLETRINTLSRAGDEQRYDDKGRFERIIQQINEENRVLTEKYRISQQAMMKQDEEIIKWKNLCQQRDQEIILLHQNWKQLHENFSNSIKEYKILQNQNDELRQMARNQAQQDQNMMNAFRTREPRSDQTSQRDDSQKAASLRNNSIQGDIKSGLWIQQEKGDRDPSIKENNFDKQNRSANISQDESALNIEYLDKSNIKSGVYHLNQHQPQNQGQQTFQNNINVKNYQPIQITIASPSEQTLALVERCQKLEQYCRELIRTNKILDCENRLAISQIINLTDPKHQLQNLTAALSFIAKSGKIYEKKPMSMNRVVTSTNIKHNNKENVSYRAATGFNREMSLRNLNALRQVGAPPLSNVFQNNNSSFIVEKFNGMLSNETGKHFGDSQALGRSAAGRNANNKYMIPYQSSNCQHNSKPSQRDLHSFVNLDSNQGHTYVNADPGAPLQRVNTAVHIQENKQRTPHSQIDFYVSELQKEVADKGGVHLNIRKVTEGYYLLNDQMINLKIDDDNSKLLIRIQEDDSDGNNSQNANIRDQISRITSSTYVDFIDFLIQQGYINIDGEREQQ